MALNKKVLVLAGLLIPFFAVLLMSHNTFAADQASYSQANVDFYSSSQIQATVNLPWNANPGTNAFYLNNLYFNNTAYSGQSKAFISGRVAADIRPNAPSNSYICGWDVNYAIVNGQSSRCYGDVYVIYSDGTRSVVEAAPVFMNYASATYTIYFDFSKELDPSKTINFIQFRFEAAQGYDVYSKNVAGGGITVMILVSGRSSIETYASMEQISNELLQTQITQNNTIINQNNTYYNHEYEAEDNIKNQSASDIPNSSSGQTTSLIGFLSGFVSAITSSVGQGNDCSFRLQTNELPDGTSINMMVDPCVGRDKFTAAGGDIFFDVFLPIIAIMFYLPFVIFILRLIYKEIRSFTN